MKFVWLALRILLGLGFVVFGTNILHPFLPQPPFAENSPPMQFMMLMGPSSWMAVVGLFQLIGGILVLIGGTAPLGLLLLAPVLVNIVLFHVLLEHGEGVAPGLVFSLIEIALLYAYRDYYRPLLTTRAKPR